MFGFQTPFTFFLTRTKLLNKSIKYNKHSYILNDKKKFYFFLLYKSTSELKMDSKGQVNVAGAAVAAIVGIIGIIIFAEVYAGLNTSNVSTSAVSLLNLTDLLLAAVLIIGIVAVLTFVGMRR
jgi:hypothetical protein